MCEKFQLSPFPRKTFEWNARFNEKSHNKLHLVTRIQ